MVAKRIQQQWDALVVEYMEGKYWKKDSRNRIYVITNQSQGTLRKFSLL